jgi:hypothetical protein
MEKMVVVQRKLKGVEMIKTTFKEGKKKVLYNVKTEGKNIAVDWNTYSALLNAKGFQLQIMLNELVLES